MEKKLIVAFALILILGIALRSVTLQYWSFTEPDSFMYYSIIQQTLANNFTITSQLSGFPQHSPYDEKPGLIYITALLAPITNNVFVTMLMLPLLSSLFEMLVVYLLTRELTDSKYAPLVSMLLFAMLPAAIWKNSAGEYRGESFVPLFVGLLVLCGIKLGKEFIKDKPSLTKMLICLFGCSASLAMSITMWKGGIYIYAVLLLAVPTIACFVLLSKGKSNGSIACIAAIILTTFIGMAGLQLVPYFNVSNSVTAISEVTMPTIGTIVLNYGFAFFLTFIGLLLSATSKKVIESKYLPLILLLPLFITTLCIQTQQVRFNILLSMPLSIFAGYAICFIYEKLSAFEGKATARYLIGMMLLSQIIITAVQVPFYRPVNGIDEPYLNSMLWIADNTPKNATFLTLWCDGSLIEGWAGRQSYSDSIMGLGRSLAFNKFLFEEAGNITYLQTIKPDYLLVRKYWLYENHSIALQAGLPYNQSYANTNFQALESGNLSAYFGYMKQVYTNGNETIYKVGITKELRHGRPPNLSQVKDNVI